MASAAEQLASNLSLGVFSKATELKKRIWFTLGALIVYRIGTYIPIPGVDASVMTEMLNQHGGGILGMFDNFTGGALRRMTVFALNIMPYISASIIIQLMTAAIPSLETLKKEGEAGRKKLNQYTRYLTVFIAMFQSYGIAVGLESMHGTFGPAVLNPGLFFRVSCVITLVGGTVFLMWLGEQITARGVGNGTSLIIMAGIVAGLPTCAGIAAGPGTDRSAVADLHHRVHRARGVRHCVHRVHGTRAATHPHPVSEAPGWCTRMFGGDLTHMPLKINTSGVIPPIFASSILLIPATVAGFSQGGPAWLQFISNNLGPGAPLHMALYAAMIIFFSYFYTAVVFNPEETADNLKKYGGFIPGIRPGSATAEYFDHVLTRLTTVGGLYLVAVCLLPEILIADYGLPFYFGGTSILIVVSVTMDTVTQIQSHLLAHQYEGLIRKARVRGRR